jgi:hypothetical protein
MLIQAQEGKHDGLVVKDDEEYIHMISFACYLAIHKY